jgi:tetratricopeptide (TPR) repeat protein
MKLEEIYNKDKKKIIIPAAIMILLLLAAVSYIILQPYFYEKRLREQWASDSQKKIVAERLNQAEKRLKESKEKNDKFASYNDIALLRYSLNDYEGAIEYWKKAVELFPDNSLVYYNMGNAYRFLEDYEKAEEMYKKSLSVSGMPDKSVYSALAGLYKKMGQEDKIIKIYKEWLVKFPRNIMIIKNLAEYYKNKGWVKNAEEYYNKWLEIDPDSEEAKKAIEELGK